MTVWFKQGVVGDPSIPMLKARRIVHDVYKNEYGSDLFITSIRDGNHSAGSLHYNGNAEDYRYPRGVDNVERREFMRNTLINKLGQNYDVVVEGDHLHIEYDPK